MFPVPKFVWSHLNAINFKTGGAGYWCDEFDNEVFSFGVDGEYGVFTHKETCLQIYFVDKIGYHTSHSYMSKKLPKTQLRQIISSCYVSLAQLKRKTSSQY